MDTQERFVITINRQFGTNGRQIASALAEKLQVKLIDKQILTSLCEKLEVSEEEVREVEVKKKTWWQQVMYYYRNTPTPSIPVLSELTSDQLYKAQVEIMKSLAEEESCVVVGRCGFDVFKNHPNAISIFLFSDLEDRVAKVREMYGLSEEEALKRIKEVDEARESFTREHTGRYRNDATNYDVCINVSEWGEQGTFELILSLFR